MTQVIFIVACMVAAIGATPISSDEFTMDETAGVTFTVKSVDDRYGFLRRYGVYAPDNLDLLEFSTSRGPSSFKLLWRNGVLKELTSGKCFNLISSTNQQLVLKSNCYGSDVPRWKVIKASPGQWYLKNIQTGKCLSPWNYGDRAPSAVKWVPGLDDCREYNKVILKRVSTIEPAATTFTVKSAESQYGSLRRYGTYAPDKLDLLEFSTLRSPGHFRLVRGVLQEVTSGKCFNLISPTNQQLVLTSKCYGSDVPKWRIYKVSSNLWYIRNTKTGKCLSPWNYGGRAPFAVKWVPGLDGCRDYNKVILNYDLIQ